MNAAPVVKVSASAAPKPASKAAAAVPKRCVGGSRLGLPGARTLRRQQSPWLAGSSGAHSARMRSPRRRAARPGGGPAPALVPGSRQSPPGSRVAGLTPPSCRAGRTPSWLPLRWPPPRWLPGYAGYRRRAQPNLEALLPAGRPARCPDTPGVLGAPRAPACDGTALWLPAGGGCLLVGCTPRAVCCHSRPDACCLSPVCVPSPPRR